MSFKNLDKSDSKQTFSHIGAMENFKQTHDYKMISKAPQKVVDEEKAKGEKYKEMLEKVLENIKSMENM